MSATPLTNEKADEIVKALNDVTAELQNCLKTVGGGAASSVSPPPPPSPSSNIKLTLLLKVASADAIEIDECRITNKRSAPTDLSTSHTGELWFTHEAEFTSSTSSGIGLSIGGTIAVDAVTFLGGSDKNTKEITIQDEIINNIIKVIDDKTTGIIDVVYLSYDAKNSPPWSVVADGSNPTTTIQLVPDIVVGKGASDANKYIICFADETVYADGTEFAFMDGTAKEKATADTITQINAELAKIAAIPIIKGGRRRRQTRKGGKRYRRKSRRFR